MIRIFHVAVSALGDGLFYRAASARYRSLMLRLICTSLVLVMVCVSAACRANDVTVSATASAPHDPGAFTQGLIFYRDAFYESTGEHGASRLRRVDPASGRVLQQTQLPARFFGEGLARVGNRLYWLTWKSGRAFVFDARTFEQLDVLRYAGQGWGLTWNGTHLIMSDGSATLRFLDAADFSVVSTLHVRDNGQPIDNLNELEYIDGAIWANVWYSDRILRIDPVTGDVLESLDASGLRAALPDNADRAGVLNGIAWDADNERLFVTGKNWPRIFQIGWPAKPAAEMN